MIPLPRPGGRMAGEGNPQVGLLYYKAGVASNR